MKQNYECALDELRAIEGYCPDHFDESEQVQQECAAYIRDHYRSVRLALENAVKSMSPQHISNTEILMFILGWHGGTIHQLSDALGVPAWRILNAEYNDMQDLIRMAQLKRYQPTALVDRIAELEEALKINDAPCQWQPIETAPRDKRILVRTENEIYAAHWAKHPETGDEAWIVAEWGDEGDQALVKPIEWHPLPGACKQTMHKDEARRKWRKSDE